MISLAKRTPRIDLKTLLQIVSRAVALRKVNREPQQIDYPYGCESLKSDKPLRCYAPDLHNIRHLTQFS